MKGLRSLTWAGIVISAVWVTGFAIIVFAKWKIALGMTLNEVGDFLAGFSAPLALLWLVIGYFQQGKELHLNTEALKAQQEELRRQVEETAFLAKNAERQAAASENLAELSEAEQERRALREKSDAQPVFLNQGGSSGGGDIKTNVLNRGGEASKIRLDYSGNFDLTISPTGIWENGQKGVLHLRQKDAPISYPFEFSITYTDKFREEHTKSFRYLGSHNFEELVEK